MCGNGKVGTKDMEPTRKLAGCPVKTPTFIIAEKKGKEMYRIDYGDSAAIYQTAVKIMSESRERYGVSTAFSVILDKESRRPAEGDVEMPEGDLTFRFYSKLTGWDGGDSYGFQVDDVATDFEFTNGSFSGTAMVGKGSWHFAVFDGGTMHIVVDMNNNTVKFTMK